jgi:hypothetical protein
MPWEFENIKKNRQVEERKNADEYISTNLDDIHVLILQGDSKKYNAVIVCVAWYLSSLLL